MIRQRIKTARPELAIVRDPCVYLAKLPRLERVDALLSPWRDGDKARLAKDPQVSRDGWLRELGKFSNQFSSWTFR
jgi:hypothetical protein